MPGREEMLSRIRRALGRQPALGGAQPYSPDFSTLPGLGVVMPPITQADLIGHFERELERVDGSPHQVSSPQQLRETLGAILDSAQAHSVVLSRNPLLGQLGLESLIHSLGRAGLAVVALSPARSRRESSGSLRVGQNEPGRASAPESPGARDVTGAETTAFRESCFAATVGITGVDFALAETGSLVVSSRTEGSQLSSLAPPVHVALYRRRQVVESLEEVLAGLEGPESPDGISLSDDPREAAEAAPAGRSVVFITGPSRTADIEQILIRGVHGPREVHAILVEESCLSSA